MKTPLDVWFEMTTVEKIKAIGFCVTISFLLWLSTIALIIIG